MVKSCLPLQSTSMSSTASSRSGILIVFVLWFQHINEEILQFLKDKFADFEWFKTQSSTKS